MKKDPKQQEHSEHSLDNKLGAAVACLQSLWGPRHRYAPPAGYFPLTNSNQAGP